MLNATKQILPLLGCKIKTIKKLRGRTAEHSKIYIKCDKGEKSHLQRKLLQ